MISRPELVLQAVNRAQDARSFPEQLQVLGVAAVESRPKFIAAWLSPKGSNASIDIPASASVWK